MVGLPWDRSVVWCLICLVVAPSLGRAQRPPAVAELLSVAEDWTFTLDVGGRTEVAAEELVYWGAFRERARVTQLVLRDGSALIGDLLSLDQQRLRVATEFWGSVEIPRSLLRGMVLNTPEDLAARDQLLQQVARANAETDLVWLENGDILRGAVSAPPAGRNPATEIRLTQRLSARAVPIELWQVLGLTFAAQDELPSVAGRRVELGWRDGSRLLASGLRISDRSAVELELGHGVHLTAETGTLWQAVTWVQPLGFARIDYLSDREPLGFRQIPFLDLPRPWRPDRNVLGGALRAEGKRYSKGIGMAPAARLSFAVPPEAEKFEAELALDDRAGGGGSVTFRVFRGSTDPAAERIAWEKAYESPLISGASGQLPISVEVSGASHLALLVDFADRGDELDYANWLNARFQMAAPVE